MWLEAAIYDRFMRASEEASVARWRAELLADLSGEVLEVGAGTGLNLAHYGPGVTRLVLNEPDRHMRAKLAPKLERTRLAAEVELGGHAIESPAIPADAFDAVVCTLVLCSVPDQATALGAIHRALRPGGRLVLIEHVAAEGDPRRLAWQRRLEPIWTRVAGNCHLTRRTEAAVSAAGFVAERVERESMRKALPFVRPTIRGVFRKPEAAARAANA